MLSHPAPGGPPDKDAPDPEAPPAKALHPNAWNLLLLVPLLMLITPVFNQDSPRLLGMPFFYWYQFAWVPVGVICVALVYVKTKHHPADRHNGAQ